MRIRIWQAFASNNSGSYTLVGRFHDDDTAREASDLLAQLVIDQSNWIDEHRQESGREFSEAQWESSPLATFHRAHGLPWTPRSGEFDDWPEYGAPPSVLAVSHQVIVFAPYTVSLVPTFAAFLIARSGRVQTELDHSHAPLVCAVECWWPYNQEIKPVDVVRAAVDASDRFASARKIVRKPDHQSPYLWRTAGHWMEPPLLLAAVFEDLIGGVAAVAEIVRSHGGHVSVRIVEAENHAEPLAAFESRVRLVVDPVGPEPAKLAAVLMKQFALAAVEAHGLVKQPPILLGEWPERRADELRAELEAAGATVIALPVARA